MADEFATLEVRVDARPVAEATATTDKFTASAGKAESATTQLASAANQSAAAIRGETTSRVQQIKLDAEYIKNMTARGVAQDKIRESLRLAKAEEKDQADAIRATNRALTERVAAERAAYAEAEKRTQQARAAAEKAAYFEKSLRSQLEGGTTRAAGGIGRLGQSLTSFATHLDGMPPVLGRLGYALGSFAVGGAVTVGVVAGIALISEAYQLLTADARRAQKQIEDSAKAIRRMHEASISGPITLEINIEGAERKIAQLTTRIQTVQRIASGQGIAGELAVGTVRLVGGVGGALTGGVMGHTDGWAQGANLAEYGARRLVGMYTASQQRELDATRAGVYDAREQQHQVYTAGLAELASQSKATEAMRREVQDEIVRQRAIFQNAFRTLRAQPALGSGDRGAESGILTETANTSLTRYTDLQAKLDKPGEDAQKTADQAAREAARQARREAAAERRAQAQEIHALFMSPGYLEATQAFREFAQSVKAGYRDDSRLDRLDARQDARTGRVARMAVSAANELSAAYAGRGFAAGDIQSYEDAHPLTAEEQAIIEARVDRALSESGLQKDSPEGRQLAGAARSAAESETRRRDFDRDLKQTDTAAQRAADALTKKYQRVAQEFAADFTSAAASAFEKFFETGTLNLSKFLEDVRKRIIQTLTRILTDAITQKLIGILFNAGAGGAGSGGGAGGGGGASPASLGFGLGFTALNGGRSGGDFGGFTALSAAGGGGRGGTSGGLSPLGKDVASAGIGFGIGDTLGQSFGEGAGLAGGALGGAAAGFLVGGPIGAAVGGVAGFLGGLFGGSAHKKQKRAEEDAKRQALKDFQDSLAVRALVDAGNDAAATKLKLQQDQAKELTAAQKQFGANSAQVRQLQTLQAQELANAAYSATPAGVYLAPSNFDAASYRYTAGRPGAPRTPGGPGDAHPWARGGGINLSGSQVTITVPEGTPRDQARQIVQELQAFSVEQFGTSNRWGEVAV